MIYKTLHRKLKFEQHEPYKNRVWIQVLQKRVSSFCSTSGTHRVTVKRQEHDMSTFPTISQNTICTSEVMFLLNHLLVIVNIINPIYQSFIDDKIFSLLLTHNTIYYHATIVIDIYALLDCWSVLWEWIYHSNITSNENPEIRNVLRSIFQAKHAKVIGYRN